MGWKKKLLGVGKKGLKVSIKGAKIANVGVQRYGKYLEEQDIKQQHGTLGAMDLKIKRADLAIKEAKLAELKKKNNL